ncbi:Aspartate aminotransferase [hydrothermal vent metagenome]|uniref:cysteine-S-conjugate beta-lyase n=1 Tax=hydrothermal vent metagenome TaxID=652676 RepID=A0A3B0UDC5_9ZZZZ
MAAKFDKYKKDIDRSTFVRYNKNYLTSLFGTTDIAPFWVADSDFMVMPELAKALKKTAKRGIYPYELKTPSIKQPLIDWFKKRHKIEIKMDGLLFTVSVNTGLAAAIDELTTKGDGVIIQPPVYQAFKGIITGVGRKVVNNKLTLKEGKYEIDFADLEKKASDKNNTAMLLCSPHNPVGRVWKKEELEKISKICIANNVLMLTDEIHADIIYSGATFVGMTEVYKGKSDNIIMLGSAGKSFGIPGLVDSFIYSPNPTLKKAMQERIMRFHLGKSNAFGNAALKTVYTHGYKWLDTKIDYLEKTVALIEEFLCKNIPEVTFTKPEGTYQVWLNFNKVAKNDEGLKELLFKKAKLGITLGTEYGIGGKGFARMNIASPRPMIMDALKRLKKALKE